MYTHAWNKYLPVIRILLKRSVREEQSLPLSVPDFDKTGSQKKVGFTFTLAFKNGRIDNLAGLSPVAKELHSVLLEDTAIRGLLGKGEYHFSLNSKLLLGIKQVTNEPEVQHLEEGEVTI